VKEKQYDGTIFHRVIPGFMIQGGGMEKDMKERPTHDPIPNEADNGLKNVTGSIAMARTNDPNSATAQFFINVKDNTSLDHRGKTTSGWGYAVFGKVIAGMDVVKKIEAVKTTTRPPHQDVPEEPVIIKSIRIVE
jgi:peptidyl-prolyl cis-trans isomerase B (cyclophilin B)